MRADGKIKTTVKPAKRHAACRRITKSELAQVCKKKPQNLFIASGRPQSVRLSKSARSFLSEQYIDYDILPLRKAAVRFNQTPGRKAIIVT